MRECVGFYWCETGPVSFAGGGAAVYGSQPFPNGFKSEAPRFASLGDWAAWQARGHDPDGVVADPLLVAAANGDFRTRPDSPASKLGFLPWEMSAAGRRN